jgi:hypothetical protein
MTPIRRLSKLLARIPMTGVLLVLLSACLATLPASCDDTPESPRAGNASKTLSTLKKVDDYPLYVMRYYGDYEIAGDIGAASRGDSPLNAAEIGGVWGCTTFAASTPSGDRALARNFDWYDHMALLLYTDPPDGWASVSMVDLSYLGFVLGDASDANMKKLLLAPSWPFDGMNEHGVSIGMMAVPHAEGGNESSKTTIGSLTVIRLVLDYAKNVDDAVSLLSRYNIDFSGGPPVHYLVSDAGRRSVVIEFLDNEMVVIPSDGSWQVATNFIMAGYPFDDRPSDCWRYNTVYNALLEKSGIVSADEVIGLLEECSQPITMWSVVYGGSDGTISVAAGRQYTNVHLFTMAQLDSLR